MCEVLPLGKLASFSAVAIETSGVAASPYPSHCLSEMISGVSHCPRISPDDLNSCATRESHNNCSSEVVSKEHSWLACSPDGRMPDSIALCPEGFLETVDNPPKNHNYHYQIQCQMYNTGVTLM